MRTCIVSGGTGGLGGPVTSALLEEGWRVVVPWVAREELATLPHSDQLVTVEADLFDEKQVSDLVRVSKSNPQSPLSAVVNLVGGFAMGPRVADTPVTDFDNLLTLNLRPTHLLTRAALPALVDGGGGSIVAVSAQAAFSPFSGAASYITAKAAVWSFIHAVATEYKGERVRANAILPSVIDTPANREAHPQSDRSGWVDPKDIAKVIAFLISSAGVAVTGARIPVAGPN